MVMVIGDGSVSDHDLEPFEHGNVCDKCGCIVINKDYIKDTYAKIYNVEYLMCRCTKCNYKFNTKIKGAG